MVLSPNQQCHNSEGNMVNPAGKSSQREDKVESNADKGWRGFDGVHSRPPSF